MAENKGSAEPTSGAATPFIERKPVEPEPLILLPWSALVVLIYTIFAASYVGIVLLVGTIGPRWENPDPDEIWHTQSAVFLIFSAVMTEMCFLACSCLNIQILGEGISKEFVNQGLYDSWLTLGEYLTKMVAGVYMAMSGGGIAHTDVQAIGGPRPVYFARFTQWAIAVPILILITNRTFLSDVSTLAMLLRSGPGLLAAFFYAWAAWVMEVTTNPVIRWTMLFTSMTGVILVTVDQVVLAMQCRHDHMFRMKCGMLAYQVSSFVLYALAFLSGRFGLTTSLQEQSFYAYGDATIKVLQGAILAIIRNQEGLYAIRKFWLASVAAKKDLDTLLDKANVPIFTIDLEARITKWNASMQKLTGQTSDDMEGKPLLEIICKECKEEVETILRTMLDGKADGNFTPPLMDIQIPVKKDKSMTSQEGIPDRRSIAMTFVPASDENAQMEGITAIGHDLSDLAHLKIVQERKSALMAMLSHEIRSPLHGMLGLTGALLDTPAGQSMKRQLGMVKGCAARLLDLVTNIMDLAQNEKKRQSAVPMERPSLPVDFGAIADEVITMTTMAVDKMNKPLLKPSVRLVNRLEDTQLPLVPGEPHKCTQLVYNLMTNACKFTERGTVTISARYLKDAQRLEVDVTDTGRGISEEGQKRIFQPFEQESSGDTRSFQGIGLGLAVCKDIAEIHGGDLRVASKLGHGSTFTFSMFCDGKLGIAPPRDKAPAVQPAAPATTAPAPSTSTLSISIAKAPGVPATSSQSGPESPISPFPTGRRPLVLSVDDDHVNQEVIKSALSDMCDLHISMDGIQALKYLQGLKETGAPFPDMVLLDIQMPGLSGFEVCSEIRKKFEDNIARMPITLLSARLPVDQTSIQGFDVGSTDFLPKPYNPEVLKRKVAVALKLKMNVSIAPPSSAVSTELTNRVKALEAEKETLTKAAEQNREQATKYKAQAEKYQGMWESMQLEVQQLQRQLKGLQEAPRAPKMAPIEEKQELAMSSKKVGKTLAPSFPSEKLHNHVRKQRQMISELSQALSGSQALVKVLSSRLQMLGSMSQQCRGLLEVPQHLGPKLNSLVKGLGDDEESEVEIQHSLELQLQTYKMVANVLNSELQVIERASAPSHSEVYLQ